MSRVLASQQQRLEEARRHLLTPETELPACTWQPVWGKLDTFMFKGAGLSRKDREGSESKGAERGKILPSTRESLWKSLLVPKLPFPHLYKSDMLDDDNDCFYCWLLCARH